MDYTMEDTQNSAPETLEATKLSGAGQRNDTQSVTKRFVVPPAMEASGDFDRSADLPRFNALACRLSLCSS
jgi:hypothetical protein